MEISAILTRLTPAEAVIDFDAEPDYELRGRLVGPTCEYSTTVEVAYPIRHGRIFIPEPAWWDTESPFLYAGPIEVWRDSIKCAEAQMRVGLSHKGTVDGRYVINGKPTPMCLDSVRAIDETDLRARRAQGRNAVLVPAALAEAAYEIGDRIGLFVLTFEPVTVNPLVHPCAVRM